MRPATRPTFAQHSCRLHASTGCAKASGFHGPRRNSSGFNGKPAGDEARRKRRIDRIELHGNAGMARVTLDYPTVTFTDYFVLLKVDGEWKIASKVYDATRK